MWKHIKPWIIPAVEASQPHEALQPLTLRPGLTHYRLERNGQWVRYHLRVENNGQALLLVAAAEAVRLTRSGAIAAFGVLEGKSDEEISRDLANSQYAASIIADVRKMIAELGTPNKRYPVFNLTDPLDDTNPSGLIAPFQADIVLGNWETTKPCLDALWQAGIPHVRFIGADPRELDPNVFNHSELDHRQFNASRIDALCKAVQYAEDIGMIAGLRMRASSLLHVAPDSEQSVLDRVAELGLDYIAVPWGVEAALHDRLFGEGDYDHLWKGIRRADHWELTSVLEVGLFRENVQMFDDQLDKAVEQGVQNVEVFALATTDTSQGDKAVDADKAVWCTPFEPQNMRQLASWVEDLADDRQVRVIWLPPLTSRRPMTCEVLSQLVKSGPRTSGDVSIRVRHDGQVIASHGPVQPVGRVQLNAWPQLWNHPNFYEFREVIDRNPGCSECSRMAICAVRCPADPAGWAIED